MEEPKNFKRHLPRISEGITRILCQDQPDMTEGAIKMAAQNFAEFIRVLKQVDTEQKAKHG